MNRRNFIKKATMTLASVPMIGSIWAMGKPPMQTVKSTSSGNLYTQHYDNGVFIDQTNGYNGDAAPIGTWKHPCNNINDAFKIVDKYKLPKTLFIKGDLDLSGVSIINGYTYIFSDGGSVQIPTINLDGSDLVLRNFKKIIQI